MSADRTLMVSVSGVRGLLGSGMDPETAARYTAAYARVMGVSHVIVGRDTRASGPSLSAAVTAALNFMGVDVTDIGIAATPTVEVMVEASKADGGVIVTASHNDERWNALKFLDGNGEFIGPGEVEGMKALAGEEDGLYGAPSRAGSLSVDGTADSYHVDRILSLGLIDGKRIAKKGIKAAVDCVNGAGSRIVPMLLERLGVEVAAIHTDVDSPFPHDPEPRPANLTDLSRAVRESGAAVGFACDPDADRLVLVREDGEVCSEELTLALAADFVLSREKGPLAANLSSSRLLDDVARRHGTECFRSKVGEVNVIAVMKDCGAVIGGEGNGGVIYPAVHYGRDAMTGMALILQMLAEEGGTLGEKAATLPAYTILKEKLPLTGGMDSLEAVLRNEFRGDFNSIDGIRIDMEEGWVHVRPSNTEPVLRIIAEATSESEAEDMVAKVRSLLT